MLLANIPFLNTMSDFQKTINEANEATQIALTEKTVFMHSRKPYDL